MQPLKIGISIRLYTPNSGGLQHHAASLIQHLRGLGHQVKIVTRAVSRTPSSHDYFYFSESRASFESIDHDLKNFAPSALVKSGDVACSQMCGAAAMAILGY